MNKQRSLELKVGAVSLIGIIILIVGIVLGKGVNVSSNKQIVKFKFNNSGGVTDGSPIVVNGVKRGVVRTVQNENGAVIIGGEINDVDDFKADVSAKITILEVTGGKKIEVNPGIAKDKYDINKNIPGIAAADIPDLVAQIGEVSGNAINLVKRLDTITASMTRIMNNAKFENDLKRTLENTAELTANLNSFVKENYAPLQATLKDVRAIASEARKTLEKNGPEVEKLLNKLDQTLADAQKLLSKVDVAVADATALIKNVDGITKDVKNGQGVVSKMIYDKSFAEKLDSTMNALTNLVNQIQANGVNVNVRLGTRP